MYNKGMEDAVVRKMKLAVLIASPLTWTVLTGAAAGYLYFNSRFVMHYIVKSLSVIKLPYFVVHDLVIFAVYLLIIIFVISLIRVLTYAYFVTHSYIKVDSSVLTIHLVHIFTRYVEDMPISSIENIEVNEPLWCHVLRCGHLRIVGKGGGVIYISAVNDPYSIVRKVTEGVNHE